MKEFIIKSLCIVGYILYICFIPLMVKCMFGIMEALNGTYINLIVSPLMLSLSLILSFAIPILLFRTWIR